MGLNDEQVLKSRKEYGSNEESKIKGNTFLQLLLESFGDPIIKILLLALLVKVVFLFRSFDIFETLGILVAVLLSTLISTLSEYGSEAAFKKLKEDSEKLKTKVYRNNILIETYANDIVQGDTILLSTGDKVPADGYLISGNLSLDESLLNGETKEAKKTKYITGTIENNNKVLKGTVVYSGNANVLITSVGDNTIYGSISKELQEKAPDSPLKLRLVDLAKKISILGYTGALLAVITYLFTTLVVNNNYDVDQILLTITNFEIMSNIVIYSLTLCVTIIVLAVPEGLPLMLALVLSSNIKKMVKQNILVRKMVGIETAGSLNILLTDKTGTLTKGKLQVTSIYSYDGSISNTYEEIPNNLKRYYFNSLYYNNESIYSDNNIIGGNSSDKALMYFVKDYYQKEKVIDTKPFSSALKYSSTTLLEDNKKTTYIKGAPEVLLDKVTHYINDSGNKVLLSNKSKITKQIDSYTKLGSRVIALCIQKDDANIFLGLVAIKDEIRKESLNAINSIKNAGIDVIMITGDALSTAKVIAKECNIINKSTDMCITSSELNNLTDEEIINNLSNIKVIARALPSDKSRLVSLSKQKNLVVGMTGDGVNDAPALKKSDVGFAMGSGTEVAKEAGDIVILDDNINSIAKSILFGRTIFKNIRKFVVYQLSINISALIISIVGNMVGIIEPITIIQMLWLNMIMDTFAGLAFSYEQTKEEYMLELPKTKQEPIINKYMYSAIATSGIYTSIICILFLKVDFFTSLLHNQSITYIYTAYFALFIFLGICNAFNARTTRINIFSKLHQNPVFIIVFTFIFIAQIYIIYNGGNIFRTYGIDIIDLIFLLLLSTTTIYIDILRKLYLKTKQISIEV